MKNTTDRKNESVLEDVCRRISVVKRYMPVLYLITDDRDVIYDVLEQSECFELKARFSEKEESVAALPRDGKLDCYNVRRLPNSTAISDIMREPAQLGMNNRKAMLLREMFPDSEYYLFSYEPETIKRFLGYLGTGEEWFSRTTLLILSTKVEIPEAYEEYVELIDVPRPGMYDIKKCVLDFHNKMLAESGRKPVSMEEYDRQPDEYLAEFKGLSRRHIQAILYEVGLDGWICGCGLPENYFPGGAAGADYQKRVQKVKRLVRQQKKQIALKDGSITFEDEEPESARGAETAGNSSISDLGGMAGLKQWIGDKKRILENRDGRAEKMGEQFPKGILLSGLPGSGKSFAAKSVARELGDLPLIRFRSGDFLNRNVGGSEERLERVIKLIEAMEPCVVWMDEIEKDLATDSSGRTDGGVGSRCMARILSWMQDTKSRCFFVATANKIENLPSELQRRGRFDRNFYTFLPLYRECVDIFEKQMNKLDRAVPGLLDKNSGEAYRKETGAHPAKSVFQIMGERLFDYAAGAFPDKFYTGADIEGLVNDARSLLFCDESVGLPIAYATFEDALRRTAAVLKPYGESQWRETLRYWCSLWQRRYYNAAVPRVKNEEEKYRYMLMDFGDLRELASGEFAWREDLRCFSDSLYDRNLYEKLKMDIPLFMNAQRG